MQKTKDKVRGFLIPQNLNSDDIWEDQESYTLDEPFADFPEPNTNSKMFVGATGDTDQDTDLTIITQRAGVPTTAEYVVFDNDPLSNNVNFGANHDFIISNWVNIRPRTSTNEFFKRDVLSFADGSLLIAFEKFIQPNIRKIEVLKVANDGSTSSTDLTLPIGLQFAQTGTPALCVLPDSTILCFVCIEVDNNVNVRMYRSIDKGSSFTLASKQVLNEAIGTDTGSNGYNIEQVRALSLNGQIMLVFSLYSYNTTFTYQNHVMQYASVDGGGNFQRVTTNDEIDSNGFHMVDLFVNKDRFCAVYIGATDEIHFMSIPHAFFSMHSLRSAGKYTKINAGGSANDFASGSDTNMSGGCVSAWSSYDQNINAIALDVSDKSLVAFYGTSDIDFNSLLTNSAPASQPSVFWFGNTQYINDFKCVSYRGGAGLVHSWTTSNNGESVALMYLGGYSNITYLFRDAWSPANVPLFRMGNTYTYIPIDELQRSSELTQSGTGTETLQSNYARLQVSNTQTDLLYERVQSTLLADSGITVRGVVTVINTDTGNAPFIFQVEKQYSTGQHSKVKIVFSPSGFEVFDVSVGNTSLLQQAFNVDDGMEFIVAVYEQKCAFWYRYRNQDTLSEFFVGFTNTSLATNPTSSTAQTRIEFGIDGSPTNQTSEARIHQICVSDNYGFSDMTTFTSIDLIGKRYPASNLAYIDKGVSIFASGGTTYKDEEYRITTTSNNPIENIFYSSSPSPRVHWSSASVTSGDIPQQRIPLLISDNASNLGNDIAGLHLSGLNFKDLKIEYWNGSSWTTAHTIETSEGMKHGFVRQGKTIKQDTGNVIDHSYYFYNELKDYIAMMVNGENTEFKTIIGNSEGIFGNGTSKECVIELDSEPVQTSGTLYIIPKSITVAFDINNITSKSWSVTIPAQKTIHNQFRIGLCLFGALAITGTQYSKGRRITIEAGAVTNVTRDRTRYSRAVAPDQRTVQISWSDGVDQSAFYETNADPDYYKTSSDTNAKPTSVYQDAPYMITGILRGLQGDVVPLVYLPSIDDDTNPRIFNRRAQHMVSVLGSEISLESITGEELGNYSQGGEVFRVATMSLIEVV